MDFALDIILRVLAMGAGIAFYSWLLSYSPGKRKASRATSATEQVREHQ